VVPFKLRKYFALDLITQAEAQADVWQPPFEVYPGGHSDESKGPFERQDALKRGIGLVEWTFDPLELKNAHFNLVRLGAVVRQYIPNCYGITNSPQHAGLPTDRLVAEWWLDSERVKDVLAGNQPAANAAAERVSIPGNISEIKTKDRQAGARVQSDSRDKFMDLFQKGYVATGLEARGDSVDYILEPGHSIAGLRLPEAIAN